MMSVNQANVKANVIKLDQSQVYNDIMAFINDQANSSENTAIAYETDIRQFFKQSKKKDIEHLLIEDLDVKNSDIREYRTYLQQNQGYKNATTNRKINTIKSLYVYLKTNDYDVNPSAIILKSLKDDSRGSGTISKDEMEMMMETAMRFESYNRYMKRALIRFAFDTGMRQDAILSLKYSDIRQSEDNKNIYIVEPDFLDKGKKISKDIKADLYNLLIEAREKDARNRTDDKIFTMDAKGISQMMKRLCEIIEIDPRRKITFHSFRKGGAEYVHEVTGGDMAAVTAQGNWSSPTVPYKHYLKKQRNLAGTYMGDQISKDIFDQLSREEMVQLLKNQVNGFGDKLKLEAQEIVNNRTVELIY